MARAYTAAIRAREERETKASTDTARGDYFIERITQTAFNDEGRGTVTTEGGFTHHLFNVAMEDRDTRALNVPTVRYIEDGVSSQLSTEGDIVTCTITQTLSFDSAHTVRVVCTFSS